MVLFLGIGEYRDALRQAEAAPASFAASASGMRASAVLVVAGITLGTSWIRRRIARGWVMALMAAGMLDGLAIMGVSSWPGRLLEAHLAQAGYLRCPALDGSESFGRGRREYLGWARSERCVR